MFSLPDNNPFFKPSPKSNRTSVVSPSHPRQIIKLIHLNTGSHKTCMAYIPVTLGVHLSPHITIPQWPSTWRIFVRQGDHHPPPTNVRDELAHFQFLERSRRTTIVTGRQRIAKRRCRHLGN